MRHPSASLAASQRQPQLIPFTVHYNAYFRYTIILSYYHVVDSRRAREGGGGEVGHIFSPGLRGGGDMKTSPTKDGTSPLLSISPYR